MDLHQLKEKKALLVLGAVGAGLVLAGGLYLLCREEEGPQTRPDVCVLPLRTHTNQPLGCEKGHQHHKSVCCTNTFE